MPVQVIRSIFILLGIGLPVWAAFRLIAARRNNLAPKRELVLGLFVSYLLVLLAITVVPMPWTYDPRPILNLLPIFNLIDGLAQHGSGPHMLNFLGNIILFVPFGAFLAILWTRFQSIWQVVLIAAASSVAIEIVQYLSHFFGSYRTADIDDVMLNTTGACLGMLIVKSSDVVRIIRTPRGRLVTLSGLVALLVVTILVVLSAPYLMYFWGVVIGERVQTSTSPNGEYTAVLRRKFNLADFNFTVDLDGERVYTSPDLCGRNYDEKLIWNRSGEAVVLVVKGRRVFAYDALKRTLLGKGQLDDFDIQPDLKPFELDCAYPKDLEQ